jgi:hypothetical protein
MTLIEVVLLNYAERLLHMRYDDYLADALGYKLRNCPICGRSVLEHEKVWGETDDPPTNSR